MLLAANGTVPTIRGTSQTAMVPGTSLNGVPMVDGTALAPQAEGAGAKGHEMPLAQLERVMTLPQATTIAARGRSQTSKILEDEGDGS